MRVIFTPTRSLVFAILALVLAAGSGLVVGPNARAAMPLASGTIPESNDYFLRTWELDDGLINNNVTGIAQTADGFLWVSTLGGLQRFDGVRFTSYLSDHNPGLVSNNLHALCLASDRSLLVGSGLGGVSRQMGNHFEAILPEGSGVMARSIVQDSEGAIWVAFVTADRLVRWKNGALTEFGASQGVPRAREGRLCVSNDGKVWYGNSVGLFRFNGARFDQIDRGRGKWVKLAKAKEGGVWALRDNLLLRYTANGERQSVADLQNLSIETLFEDFSGALWLGTRNAGLIRFQDGSFVRVPVSDSSVISIFEDRERNLWVGTQGGGLNRLRPRQFFLRQAKDGVSFEDTYSLCVDRERRLWLAGRFGSLVRATDSTNRSFAMPPNWAWLSTMALCADSKEGGVWVGWLGGLTHWGEEGPPGGIQLREGVTSLLADSRSNLWVGTIHEGLICYHDGKFDHLSKKDGFTMPRALAEDSRGRIWVGTEEGFLFVHAPQTPMPSSPALTWSNQGPNGFTKLALPENKPLGQIVFIVPDGDRTCWIGAGGRGIFRLRDGALSHPPTELGLPLYDVRSLNIDGEGNFWIGTGHGLIRMSRAEMEAAMQGRQKPPIRYVLYGPNDGLPNVEFAYGFRNATLKTPDGHLWFATTRGALEIVPKVGEEAPITPSQVMIEEVRLGDIPEDFDSPSHLVLPPRPGMVQIRYTLPQLSRPGQVRFRYRLVTDKDEFLQPPEENWTSTGDQRVASFAHLPPGNYRFEVGAAEAGEPWLEKTASVQFTVEAAWWETLVFRVLILVFGAIFVAWTVRKIVKRRMMARMRAVEQENAIERERTRIARDMHDQLGASLTQIAITSKLLKLDPAGQVGAHSDSIAEIARNTVESLDEIVWAVDPANDNFPALFDYLGQFAIDFLGAAGIGCEVDIPEDIPTQPLAAHVRHHLFLAIKESLNNIAKHSGATQVILRVEKLGARIRITVQDDGKGLPETLDRVGADGLRNMRDRMGEIGGQYRVESEPGRGVKSVFELPVQL